MQRYAHFWKLQTFLTPCHTFLLIFRFLWLILVENARFYGWSAQKKPFLWLIRHQNVTLFLRFFHKYLNISNLTPVTLFCQKCHALVDPNLHSTHLQGTFTPILCHGPMSCLSECDSHFWAKMSWCFTPKSLFYALLLPMSCQKEMSNAFSKTFLYFFPHPLYRPL